MTLMVSHIDDYFYPYRIAGKEFPDYQAYIHGNGLSKDGMATQQLRYVVKMIRFTQHSTMPLHKIWHARLVFGAIVLLSMEEAVIQRPGKPVK